MKLWLVAVLAPLLVLCVRLSLDARRDLAIGDVPALGRAARAWPLCGARARLAELGRRGDLAAWTELRASILATRWLLTPDRALLEEANAAIARARGVDVALYTPKEPSRALSVLALVGLGLFLFGVVRAFAGTRRHAMTGAVGFALFCVGLALA
jgi:hypothetical protein